MDILTNMNHELKDAFPLMPSIDSALNLTEIRISLNNLFGRANAGIVRNDRVIIDRRLVSGPPGSPEVGIKVYSPVRRKASPLPAILYMHPGGFFFGSADLADSICEHYVDATGCVVISVDYRLAPEYPYPAASEDCYAALAWMHDAADILGIDREHIVLCGASSGGCLAAAVALMARDRKKFKVAFQVLIYPAFDHRHITPSSQAVFDQRVWNRTLSLKAWGAYLETEDQEVVSPYASPAMAQDVSGLAPAYIVACELDLLRDEAIEYAQKLYGSGVPTELHVFSGAFHSFDVCIPNTEISIRFNMEVVNALKRAFTV